MDNTGTGTGTGITSSSRDSASNDPTWENRLETLTHILTHQTLTPSLHSQFYVACRVPCFLPWSYPPFLCPSATSLHLWSFTFFLSRASRLGFPRTTWRSLCPFQLPPPCIMSSGVEPAAERWGPEECREYARKRFRRGRFGCMCRKFCSLWCPMLRSCPSRYCSIHSGGSPVSEILSASPLVPYFW